MHEGNSPRASRGDPRAARLARAGCPAPVDAARAAITLPFLDQPPPGHRAPLRFGALLSAEAAAGADAATRRVDGFNIADARVLLHGQLHQGFDYLLQGNLRKSPVLLDLELAWAAAGVGFRASAGYFRVPVSGELQIGAPNLDLLDRSQIVNAVTPGRQIGIELRQQLAGPALLVRAGAFNGNGLAVNDDDRLLYTLRFEGERELHPPAEREAGTPAWRIGYGASGAWSRDRSAALGLGLPQSFAGERALGGADLRITRGSVFVSAEGLYASLDPRAGSRTDVWGYQATVGWTVTRLVQILGRYDAFTGGSLASDRDLAIGSIVLNFSRYASLQTELRVPTRGADPTPGGVIDLSIQF